MNLKQSDMKLVNIEIIKDELERLIRNYRFYSSTEAKYRYEAYKELSEWLDGLEVEDNGTVWHSFDEVLPPQSSDICVYWDRDKIITTGIWEESEKPKYASKWAYTDDLLQEPTNPFDSHIQEGDKITVNENGSRFNRSQLERVIVKQEEPVSKVLEEAAREAATWHSRNGVDRFFPNDYKKFIAGAMWQKRYDNIPQELVENYCEFIKEGGKNVCALINAVNACNAKKAECMSNDLDEAATKYAQDKYMPVQTAEAFKAGARYIMKDAIEREVKVDAGGYPYIDATELYDYENDKPLAKAGDKVKVLIVKDE